MTFPKAIRGERKDVGQEGRPPYPGVLRQCLRFPSHCTRTLYPSFFSLFISAYGARNTMVPCRVRVDYAPLRPRLDCGMSV